MILQASSPGHIIHDMMEAPQTVSVIQRDNGFYLFTVDFIHKNTRKIVIWCTRWIEQEIMG
jgi:hypothetical protein